ncbi:hypothetical protein [uncultured Mediterranean phage uvDeep-CGR2-AD10-C281]|jgi:hypothetical protein|nr:hypothetical protein [uncultured Mediterranean phage uvDeep-CGR2-AD10-C281]|tara:strand:+ start:39 stop:506 length:468 start_codon:yes stop_codon:yes gene_type:complete
MAKDLKIIPLSLKEANEFVIKYHRHNKKCQGHKFSLGAEYKGKLVGVVIVGRPVARKLDNKLTLEINRNCVLEDAPKGTCSFLYAKAMQVWQSMGGKKIITYTLSTESGSSLKAVNFNKETMVQIFKKNTGWTTRANRIWQQVQSIPRIRWGKEL